MIIIAETDETADAAAIACFAITGEHARLLSTSRHASQSIKRCVSELVGVFSLLLQVFLSLVKNCLHVS